MKGLAKTLSLIMTLCMVMLSFGVLALAEGGEARLSPPEWTTTRYRVTLVRTAGKWLISNLQAISK